jgi:hypothetical protein
MSPALLGEMPKTRQSARKPARANGLERVKKKQQVPPRDSGVMPPI